MTRVTDVFLPDSRDVHERIRTRRVADQHFDAELTNEADQILVSMKSYDPLFTTIVRDALRGSTDVFRCDTVDEQREFYRSGREHMNMTGTDVFTSIGGDWYGFVQAITTTTALATGNVGHTEIVGLLPITPDEDTIAGEIGLSIPPFAFQGDQPGAPSLQRVQMLRVFEAWRDALRAGDADALAACYADNAEVAIFNPLEGAVVVRKSAADIRDLYRELFTAHRPISVDVVMNLTDRWFVFTELLWHVTNADAEDSWFRTADVIVPTTDGKIISQLGIGTRVVERVERPVPAG